MTLLVLGRMAIADVRTARQYHEAAEVGPGLRFAESLDELFARLEAFPGSAPRVAGHGDVRRALVRAFPHVVFYRARPGRIDVLRVLHGARSEADQPFGLDPGSR